MRNSSLFFVYIAVHIVLLGFVFTHASLKRKADISRLQYEAHMVETLGLTDLCLFTEASYTRHLSQADMNTPFQDSPMTLEHFPSGSLVPPPRPSNSSWYSIPSGMEQRVSVLPSRHPNGNRRQ
jgi:hypothetical protein